MIRKDDKLKKVLILPNCLYLCNSIIGE